MSQNEIYTRLTEVFRDIFDNGAITLTSATTADDIEEWDSLNHITLISAVESEFKMTFKMGEVSGMNNVGDMAAIIEARGKL